LKTNKVSQYNVETPKFNDKDFSSTMAVGTNERYTDDDLMGMSVEQFQKIADQLVRTSFF
jgi:hypothetical protein